MSIRVLIADDAILFRRVLSDVLGSIPDVEVVGSASNGKIAVQKVRELRPDLLTLDLEMPDMDGLAVLDCLRQGGDKTTIIVVSAMTRRGGDLTLKALEKGAFDFITKPDTPSAETSRDLIRKELEPRIKALSHRLAVRSILNKHQAAPQKVLGPPLKSANPNLVSISERMNRIVTTNKPELILMGVSTGGPNALAVLLPQIPGDIGVPILIVQHMPPVFTQSLADSLNSKCSIRVREGSHGESIQPNTAYIAPGGHHMGLICSTSNVKIIQLSDAPPENNCRPSADFLFRSAAMQVRGRTVGVILTGMGNDGAQGLRFLKQQGSYVIAQDEATCVVFGMPKAAIDAGVVDAVLPLDVIASRITTIVRGGKA